jgi:hypothetical protein
MPVRRWRAEATLPDITTLPNVFFGRSANRPGTRTEAIFQICPWGLEGRSDVFCYECHEELLHNPVILPADMVRFASLAKSLGFAESEKSADRTKIAGRIRLLQEAISAGLDVLTRKQEGK